MKIIAVKSKSIFKVFFKGITRTNEDNLNLTFFGLDTSSPIKLKDFQGFLRKYNEMARKKEAVSIGNIKEIIPLGKGDKRDITQFFILLYTFVIDSKNNEKGGILIGNHNDHGNSLLGIWPLTAVKTASRSAKDYNKLLELIVDTPDKFQDLLLVS